MIWEELQEYARGIKDNYKTINDDYIYVYNTIFFKNGTIDIDIGNDVVNFAKGRTIDQMHLIMKGLENNNDLGRT